MGETLRTPLFVVAAVLIVLVVTVEMGAKGVLTKVSAVKPSKEDLKAVVEPTLRESGDLSASDRDDIVRKMSENAAPTPPGFAINYTALLDGLIAYAIGLMAVSLFLPERLHGNVQGIVTLIVSLIVLVLAVVMIFAAFTLLMVMVGLFTAAPFGTIAYLAVWGFFDRGGATAVLGLTMFLKLAFAACLVLAHPRFLQNKGLVLIVLTSLLANVIISFLHGFVPVFLVSITDLIAALISGVLAAVWAVFLLVGAVISVVKAIV